MVNSVDVTKGALSMQPDQPVEIPSARDEPEQTSEHGHGQLSGSDPDHCFAAAYTGDEMPSAEV